MSEPRLPAAHGEVPVVLGGHTFIAQLGNDPPTSEDDQRRIVEACLDRGIRWIDTTYQPERVALGKALRALGRRDEAKILAWNFFTDFAAAEPVGSHAPYEAEHIDVILEQLGTGHVDCLVLRPFDDAEENRRQAALMQEWQRKGCVRSLGLWVENRAHLDQFGDANPFRFAIHPFNVATDGATDVFRACKAAGCETLATSPFFRGWELDKIVGAASERGHGDSAALRSELADSMLRFALFHSGADRVVVAMRKVEWIGHNLASVSRGPLTAKERRRLRHLHALTTTERSWWQRLRSRL